MLTGEAEARGATGQNVRGTRHVEEATGPMNQKPKIGVKEICSLLGITPSAIRLYERYLDDRRYKVSDSGYRQFDSASFVQLCDLRYLTKCNLTLHDAAEACQETDLSKKMDFLQRGEQELLAKRDYYNAAMQQVNEAKNLLLKIRTLKDSFEYIERPGFWFFECEENHTIVDGPAERALMKRWIDLMPVVYMAYRVGMKTPLKREWDYHIGFAIPERYAHLVDVGNEHMRYIPPQSCLATTTPDEESESIRSPGFQFAKKVLSKGLRFLEQENHTLSGEIFCRLVATNVDLEETSGPEAKLCDYYYTTYPLA